MSGGSVGLLGCCKPSQEEGLDASRNGWFIYISAYRGEGGPRRWVSALQENRPNWSGIYL